MRYRISLALLILSVVFMRVRSEGLKCFKLNEVEILGGPFYQAQQTDLNYILALDVDRLLAPFLIDAGIQPKAQQYPNWENTGLDGHIGGHYLSALSFMYAATKNEEVLERLNYMIDWLDSCQVKNGNGYVGGIPGGQAMWNEIANGNIDASGFSLNNKWVPLYNIHKLYAGLRDAWLVAGNLKAREILIKLSDWCIELTKNLTDQQIQRMLRSEHGGLNEVFADVAGITGEDKYLVLAKRFSHMQLLSPLLLKQNNLTGLHANTQIPKVIGYKRIADLNNDTAWSDAAAFFWTLIHDKWTISIGGNSVEEHLHPSGDFSSMVTSVQGPETCNTYNMLKLTKLLFLKDPQAKYLDYFERALYNHILSSENPDKGGFVYFTPMRPGHYKVYSQPQQSFWCCVGSGLENHGKYGEMIYSHNDSDIFVNLFIPSRLTWEEKGIEIEQKTNFPYEEKVVLKLNLNESGKFNLNIRRPEWIGKEGMKIWVNGIEEVLNDSTETYYSVQHQWNPGDSVEVELPMRTKAEYLPDGSNWVSFIHGPVVLAAKTGTSGMTGLFADDNRWGHIPGGPLYAVTETPTIISNSDDFIDSLRRVEDKPLTFQYIGDVQPEKFVDFELLPFFSVHESRYAVYFKVKEPVVPGIFLQDNKTLPGSNCWPNPFNAHTNITFDLSDERQVSLSIYNINGIKMETLASGIYSPGNYKISWNAEGYNKGIYFYKLQAGEKIEIRKLVLQ